MANLGSSTDSHIDRRSMFALFAGCACCIVSSQAQAQLATRRFRCFAFSKNVASANASELPPEATDLQPLNFVDKTIGSYFDFDFDKLQSFFGVKGKLLGSPSSHDAYSELAQGANPANDGKIVFGKLFLDSKKDVKFGLINLTVILAHEVAHLYQWYSGDYEYLYSGCGINDRPALLTELHADFLAGVYMSSRGTVPLDVQDQLADFFYTLGDIDFKNDHHGLPGQRLLAFRAGFNTGSSYAQRREKIDIQLLSAEGKLYVPHACKQKI